MFSPLGTVRGSLITGRKSLFQRQWVNRPSTTISTHRTKSTATIHNTNTNENINDQQYNDIIRGTIPSYGKGLEVGIYDRPVVHGILLASAFSTIFGSLIPGCIYRNQSLKFHHPVFIDELLVGKVIVTKLKQVNRRGAGGILCTCDTTLHKADNDASEKKEENLLCISREAQVWLPGATLS